MANTLQAGMDTPRLLYLPELVYQAFELTNTPLSAITDLVTLKELLGQRQLATFCISNALYNLDSAIFLKHEVISGVDSVDLYELLYRKASLDNCLHDLILQVKHEIDSLQMNGFTPTRETLVNSKLAEGVTQYYVPRLFAITDNLYGVRLEALTDVDDLEVQVKNVTVANIGVLSQRYPLEQWVKTDLFKEFVILC